MAAQYNQGADFSHNGSSGVAASSATTQSASAAQPPTASKETCVQSLCKRVKHEMDLTTQESSLQRPSALLLQRSSLGKVHYRPAPDAGFQTGVVCETKLCNGKVGTALKYEGVEYLNAMEWMSTVFKNSGRACYHIIPKSVVEMSDTPRAKVYIPPNAKCGFGRYV
jgi:hypothetical protein